MAKVPLTLMGAALESHPQMNKDSTKLCKDGAHHSSPKSFSLPFCQKMECRLWLLGKQQYFKLSVALIGRTKSPVGKVITL